MKPDAHEDNEQVGTVPELSSYVQSSLRGIDTTIPTSKAAILAKASLLSVSQLPYNGENLLEVIPDIDTIFKRLFILSINQFCPHEKVTATDIMRAYEHSANAIVFQQTENAVPSFEASLSAILFQQTNNAIPSFEASQLVQVILSGGGKLVDFFEMPVLPEVITRLETSNPTLAQTYKDQIDRWKNSNE